MDERQNHFNQTGEWTAIWASSFSYDVVDDPRKADVVWVIQCLQLLVDQICGHADNSDMAPGHLRVLEFVTIVKNIVKNL